MSDERRRGLGSLATDELPSMESEGKAGGACEADKDTTAEGTAGRGGSATPCGRGEPRVTGVHCDEGEPGDGTQIVSPESPVPAFSWTP